MISALCLKLGPSLSFPPRLQAPTVQLLIALWKFLGWPLGLNARLVDSLRYPRPTLYPRKRAPSSGWVASAVTVLWPLFLDHSFPWLLLSLGLVSPLRSLTLSEGDLLWPHLGPKEARGGTSWRCPIFLAVPCVLGADCFHEHSSGSSCSRCLIMKEELWALKPVRARCTVPNLRKWQGQGAVILCACLQVTWAALCPNQCCSLAEMGIRGLQKGKGQALLCSELLLMG